jgi:hypothetical protein
VLERRAAIRQHHVREWWNPSVLASPVFGDFCRVKSEGPQRLCFWIPCPPTVGIPPGTARREKTGVYLWSQLPWVSPSLSPNMPRYRGHIARAFRPPSIVATSVLLPANKSLPCRLPTAFLVRASQIASRIPPQRQDACCLRALERATGRDIVHQHPAQAAVRGHLAPPPCS